MSNQNKPLPELFRPSDFEEFVGQKHLVSENSILRRLIENASANPTDERLNPSSILPSMIFWGPPGCGKTTLARIIAKKVDSEFINFSAVTNGIKEVRAVMEGCERNHFEKRNTILFIDEIHRFNKAQQDAFLPFVENGTITLLGATTENPSFEVNSALLSRCKVFIFNPLSADDITPLLNKAFLDVKISENLVSAIAEFANGDARNALNIAEMLINSCVDNEITSSIVEQILNKKIPRYDKKGENHFDNISALHKSMRNSDVQASLYWLCRMIDGGDDPLYIARRIVRFASEDIGMAESSALQITIAAYQACMYLGMPECGVHLAHAVAYCALAPKSNAIYNAYNSALKDCQNMPDLPVPLHIRNAPTKLMKEIGYGKDYKYAHDLENGIANMPCLPPELIGKFYYTPTNHGREKQFSAWIEKIEKLRKNS